MPALDREEYVEQAYLFRAMLERLPDGIPLQDSLYQIRQEILATTKLPMAIDFMLGELRHTGLMSLAMRRLAHYFHPFQTYLVEEAEADRGRFDMRIALQLLHAEADYRAQGGTRQGLFAFQFETLCRNRLRYDSGLLAISQDPQYDEDWQKWILTVRRQMGLVDFADLIYVRSEHFLTRMRQRGESLPDVPHTVLFGEKEGKIAFANRQRDPLYLFAALQRHLGYPTVPRPKIAEDPGETLTGLARRMDRAELRIKFLEEEQKGGIDLRKLYGPAPLELPPLPEDPL
jgi:hypothetical protein